MSFSTESGDILKNLLNCSGSIFGTTDSRKSGILAILSLALNKIDIYM